MAVSRGDAVVEREEACVVGVGEGGAAAVLEEEREDVAVARACGVVGCEAPLCVRALCVGTRVEQRLGSVVRACTRRTVQWRLTCSVCSVDVGLLATCSSEQPRDGIAAVVLRGLVQWELSL